MISATAFWRGASPSSRIARLAVRELGEAPRQKAVAEIMTRLKSPPPKTVLGSNSDRYPLELLWIGNRGDFKAAELLMDSAYSSSWNSLQALQGISDAQDE